MRSSTVSLPVADEHTPRYTRNKEAVMSRVAIRYCSF
jgi:hypothetical protein